MIPDRNTLLQKAARYCAYQERAHSEVRKKLLDIGCPYDEVDDILVALIEGNYLNEERFARSFARGRFRMKSWGRNKIRQALFQKQVGDNLIEYALEKEIEEEDYLEKLNELMNKKKKEWAGMKDFELEGKVRQWLIGRGFEADLVWEAMRG